MTLTVVSVFDASLERTFLSGHFSTLLNMITFKVFMPAQKERLAELSVIMSYKPLVTCPHQHLSCLQNNRFFLCRTSPQRTQSSWSLPGSTVCPSVPQLRSCWETSARLIIAQLLKLFINAHVPLGISTDSQTFCLKTKHHAHQLH